MFSNQFQLEVRLLLYNATRLSAINLRLALRLLSSGSATIRSCRPKQAYAFVHGDVDALAHGNARPKIRRADAFAPASILELITEPVAQIAQPK